MFFSLYLSREVSTSGYHWFMSAESELVFFKNRYESLDPLLRLKNRSTICLHRYLCVEYWNMTFLPNFPFMLTLIELIGLLHHSFSSFEMIHRWVVVKLHLP